jgi:hypothetical protein
MLVGQPRFENGAQGSMYYDYGVLRNAKHMSFSLPRFQDYVTNELVVAIVYFGE